MSRARAALALLAALAACNIDPFTIRGGGGDDDDPTTRPDAAVNLDGGGGSDGGGVADAAVCVFTGPDDQCDEIDNDCNGIVDDDFDKQTDGNNCGVCNNRCTSPGAIEQCRAGTCSFVECQPGFVDLDPAIDGCEYLCPVFPGTDEDCNGVDDDCDGLVDEAAGLPPPPAGICRVTPGTPCEATPVICASRGGLTTWFCDYDAAVEFDSSVPNGIVLEETLCDGADGDCDGAADEPFPDLGQECDNAALGVCRDVGVRACDPADTSRTVCDLSALPDPRPPASETCNGLDDDCNGVIDDATGAGRVVDSMVRINHSGVDVYVYRYEASRPGATSAREGSADARACSRSNVIPWTGATLGTARIACMAAGKRLCTRAEYQAACAGPAGLAYPYGNTFVADACNAEPFDGVVGGADDDRLLPTGTAGWPRAARPTASATCRATSRNGPTTSSAPPAAPRPWTSRCCAAAPTTPRPSAPAAASTSRACPPTRCFRRSASAAAAIPPPEPRNERWYPPEG